MLFIPHPLIPLQKPTLSHPLFKFFSTTSLPQKPTSTLSYQTLFLHLRSSPPNLPETRKLHALLLLHGYLHQNFNPVLSAQLVHNYVTLHSLQQALLLFNQLPRNNSFAWNSILRGLVDEGHFSQAIAFYHRMVTEGPAPDNFTFPLALRACSGLSDIEQGRLIQISIENVKSNVYNQCALIDMFGKCGCLSEARRVFDEMLARDLVSWGAIICGTVQGREWGEALRLFIRMRWEGFQIDSVILATVIPASGRLGDVNLGMGLHCCTLKIGFCNDICVLNALIDMYSKCGLTRVAWALFRSIKHKDVVSWSSLIAGYSRNCEHDESLSLFLEMIKSHISPCSVTLASVLYSLSESNLIKQGKEIHNYAIRQGLELDVFIATALVDLYCKHGLMRAAELIFETISDGDIALFNSMIKGYALNGDVEISMKTLRRTTKTGLKPDCVTIVTVLPLCNRFTMLNQGKELHAYVLRSGLQSAVSVNNSLIDMYCKCGHLTHGETVYKQMMNRDIVTYNTIIASFGMHGLGQRAISFYKQMREEGIYPDRVTFITLISACSHSGLVERGLFFYNHMREEYGIIPDMEHYSCMVDLYSRAGYLDEAWDFIGKMPIEPDIDVLGSLLGACRNYRRLDLAELISKRLFEKRTEDPGYHVLLSNIYADVGRWKDVKVVRAEARQMGLMKKPGNSWIQVGWHVHSFVARDKSHPEFEKIHRIMMILLLDMNAEGYVPATGNLSKLAEEFDETEIVSV